MTTSMVRKARTASDSRFGKRPEERTIEELLTKGIVVIDKPMGPTSHQVAAWVRDILRIEKTGHGGTLDPRATGVLPVGLGNAVRAMDYIHESGKKYIGVMRLHGEVDDASLSAIAKEFTGEIFQTPPVRSAVKRALRTRTVFSIEIIERIDRDVLLQVRCQGGTYVRSLCVDMGDALGIGAHLQDLRRIGAGSFSESDSVTLHDLKDAVEYWQTGNEKELRRIIMPIERTFIDWKKIVVKDSSIDALCHGAPLAVPGVAELSKDISKNDKVALFTSKDEVVASGIALLSADELVNAKDGIAVRLDRVFMDSGTYPRSWSSKSESKPGRT